MKPREPQNLAASSRVHAENAIRNERLHGWCLRATTGELDSRDGPVLIDRKRHKFVRNFYFIGWRYRRTDSSRLAASEERRPARVCGCLEASPASLFFGGGHCRSLKLHIPDDATLHFRGAFLIQRAYASVAMSSVLFLCCFVLQSTHRTASRICKHIWFRTLKICSAPALFGDARPSCPEEHHRAR